VKAERFFKGWRKSLVGKVSLKDLWDAEDLCGKHRATLEIYITEDICGSKGSTYLGKQRFYVGQECLSEKQSVSLGSQIYFFFGK
jgi:hypothetical protein